MQAPELLMIPGPTPLPDAVRAAMASPAVAHRGTGFKNVLQRVFPGLQWAFQTRQPVLLYTASGTGAMEAALVNTLNPGDRLLAVTCGVFSQRWADIGRELGLDVTELSVPAGQANLPEALRIRLAEQPNHERFKAVSLIHSETSTGVLNPLQALVSVVKDYGALSLVDTVTSLGSAPVQSDDWGMDVTVSGSQKGFMIPPGLSFLSYSPAAMAAHQQVKHPGYYFNFKRYEKAQAEFTTPYTPATHQILALDVALAQMQSEGLSGLVARHRLNRDRMRAGLQAMGLTMLMPDDTYASCAVTAVKAPEGVAVSDLRNRLRDHWGIVIADGQKELKGRIFRVGHLGYISTRDVCQVLTAIADTLHTLGFSQVKASGAVDAAMALTADSQGNIACPV